MSTAYDFHTLDVFTDTLFGGNPLAVLTDARGLSDEQMQAITREFNLSETVFVFPPDDVKHTRRVRIFTPGRELPFAGHPTVGTAFLLASLGMIPLAAGETKIVLEEGVGPVPVTIHVQDGVPLSAQLSAAQAPEFHDDVRSVDELAELLSLARDDIFTEGMRVQAVSCGVPFLIVPLVSRGAIARAKVNRHIWERTVATDWATEIYAFDASAATSSGAIRARMFAPALGIGEDPATGSAAVCLAAYLAVRAEDGAVLEWTIEQGFEMGRPSVLEISAAMGAEGVEATRVAGKAVLVSSGRITV